MRVFGPGAWFADLYADVRDQTCLATDHLQEVLRNVVDSASDRYREGGTSIAQCRHRQ